MAVTLYWVVYADGGATPSGAQVVAGQDSTGSAALASGSEAYTSAGTYDEATAITSLSPNTAYRVAWVAYDGSSYSSVVISTYKITTSLSFGYGTYSISGQSVTLLRSKVITANNGSYTYTGQTATLLKSKVVSASAGSYTYTGQTATLLRSKVISASAGSYSYTGQSATLLKSKVLVADYGTYTYTGQSVTITKGTVYNITANAGTYSISGQNATLLRSKLITANNGTYNYTGQNATISYSGAPTTPTITLKAGSWIRYRIIS